jgi:hypothetical protein
MEDDPSIVQETEAKAEEWGSCWDGCVESMAATNGGMLSPAFPV